MKRDCLTCAEHMEGGRESGVPSASNLSVVRRAGAGGGPACLMGTVSGLVGVSAGLQLLGCSRTRLGQGALGIKPSSDSY